MKTSLPSTLRNRRLVLAGAAALMVLAQAAHAAGSLQATAKSRPAAAHATPGGTSVGIDYQTSGRASIDRPYPVTIIFSNATAVPSTTVSFSSDKGLALSGAQARTLPAGKSTVTLTATPSTNGMALIHVFTRQGDQGSALSIPVRVGPEPAGQQMSGEPDPGFGKRAARLLPIE